MRLLQPGYSQSHAQTHEATASLPCQHEQLNTHAYCGHGLTTQRCPATHSVERHKPCPTARMCKSLVGPFSSLKEAYIRHKPANHRMNGVRAGVWMQQQLSALIPKAAMLPDHTSLVCITTWALLPSIHLHPSRSHRMHSRQQQMCCDIHKTHINDAQDTRHTCVVTAPPVRWMLHTHTTLELLLF